MKHFMLVLISAVAIGLLMPAQTRSFSRANDKTVPSTIDPKKYEIQPGDSGLKKLLKERVQAVAREADLRSKEFRIGRGTLDVGLDCGRRLTSARLALSDNPGDAIVILRDHVVMVREWERLNQARYRAGAIKLQDFEVTTYFRIDAEIQLLRAGGSLPDDIKGVPPIDPKDAKPNEKQKLDGEVPLAPQVFPIPPNDDEVPPTLPKFVISETFAIDPAEPPLKRLLKQRANIAISELKLRDVEARTGRGSHDSLISAAQRARDCRLGFASDQIQRLAVLTEYRDWLLNVWEPRRHQCLKEEFMCQMQYDIAAAEVEVLRANATAQELASIRTIPPPDLPPQADRFNDPDEDEPVFTKSPLYKIDQSESKLQLYPKRRMNCAFQEMRSRYMEFRVGRGTLSTFIDSGRRARDARLELSNTPAQQIAVMQEYVDFTRSIEKLNQARFEAGAIKQQDLEQTRYERLCAEIDLLRAKEPRTK